MTTKKLFDELNEAYSHDNLNKITRKLIQLYKSKNYFKIREIANKISKYVIINEEKDAKCFSKLIMLYHPDKGDNIRKQLHHLFLQNNNDSLQKYAHILLLNDLENIPVHVIDESIDYNPEYAWDTNNDDEGYSFTNFEGEDEFDDQNETNDFEKSFFNLLKIREYGRINIDLPTYYLEDFEEFEMADSGLETIDGVEYCKQVKVLDLSNNTICDISNLWDLNQLEELYLANNQIGYIDTLSNLSKLRIIDLSGNQIDDISPLFDLEELEYVNLIGNKIPTKQMRILSERGIVLAND